VLEDHLERVSGAVDTACEQARYQPLSDMVKAVVEVVVGAKMERADISVALYQISADVGGPALVKRMSQRCRRAMAAMFRTAPDTEAPPDKVAIDTMFAAISGVMRSMLEAGASPTMVRKMREHLALLCQSYMAAATALSSQPEAFRK